jgi:single-strand DNA-binding protein
MATRSINKVFLLGNLTRDPVLRYTPQGTAVADFGLATNREWITNGEKQDSVEFHNIVAWAKLGELCNQLLRKGSKVYVEGRLQTRDWQTETGEKRYKSEVVISEMLLLSGGKEMEGGASGAGTSSGNTAPSDKSSNEASAPDGNLNEEVDLDELLSGTDFDIEEDQNQ